ncbi:MAG: hypothetical protein ACD_51C00137G0002 [uncultured bacterium]|nr:MAG: hypothetical protein ACD_51C00137G0002 [uncultured bacterium]
MKDKINFDLDFLDKDAPEANPNKPVHQKKTEETKNDSHKPSKSMSDGAKKWLTGIVIVGAIALFGTFSDDSSPTISTSNSAITASQDDDGLIQTGQYRCSQYHHNRAGELEPSATDGATLDSKTAQLAAESDRMDSEKYQLENEYVDEYDQWSIDQHNESIDDYNSRLQSYRYRAQAHEVVIDNYNARVETYNNYLVANCIRAY